MPLRITLKAHERLIINGACIRNGDRTADFLVETQCKFLRESEIVRESEADTPCKKICVTLQVIYLENDPSNAVELFTKQASAVMKLMPSAAPYLSEIGKNIIAGQYHRAIKAGRKLITHEQETLNDVNPNTRLA